VVEVVVDEEVVGAVVEVSCAVVDVGAVVDVEAPVVVASAVVVPVVPSVVVVSAVVVVVVSFRGTRFLDSKLPVSSSPWRAATAKRTKKQRKAITTKERIFFYTRVCLPATKRENENRNTWSLLLTQ